MECTVVFKWVKDPETARVGVDGSVDWGRAQPAAGDDDPAAIEIAKSLSGKDDITAVTIAGGEEALELAQFCASGAPSRVNWIDTHDQPAESFTDAVAHAAKALTPDLIVCQDAPQDTASWLRSPMSGPR